MSDAARMKEVKTRRVMVRSKSLIMSKEHTVLGIPLMKGKRLIENFPASPFERASIGKPPSKAAGGGGPR